MINDILKDAKDRMAKSVDALKNELSRVRTGRASTGLVEHLRVEYYGQEVPITQVANVSVADARTLSIQLWEKDMVAPVEKAIMNSDLGLTPNSAGQLIRLNLPALTEERRRDLSKQVGGMGEDSKVAVRNIRRDANSQIKELLKEKEISEDEQHAAEKETQQLTDAAVANIDKVVAEKEQELLEM